MDVNQVRRRSNANKIRQADAESDGEDVMNTNVDLTKKIGQDKDSWITSSLEKAFFFLPTKLRNWLIRFIFSFAMIAGFVWIVRGGPAYIVLLIVALEVKGFVEVINIGYSVYRVHNLPWFRSLSWYFLICANYYFHGEIVSDYLTSATKFEAFSFLIRYHRLLSFLMYMAGIVMFVMSLVKGYYIRQFSLFAWTHVTLCLLVIHASLAVQNLFEGQFWLILPAAIVILNDIMAYMFGLLFGRTPLIALSPKKTWEGFVGGGISTLALSVAVTYLLLPFKSLICPIEYNDEAGTILPSDCTPSVIFQPRDVILPLVGSVSLSPIYLHVLILATFGSIIGPFGGFFASGFKRAFKIKDFDDIIPGHGGIMDRFDCHIVMIGFVNVYLHSVVKLPTISRILVQVFRLDPEDQMTLYRQLQESLVNRSLLNVTLSS